MKGKHDFSAFYNLGNEGALKLLRLYLSNPKEFNRRADGYISLFNKYHFTTGNVPSRWCAWYGTDNKLWEDGYADCDALKRAVSKGELVELPNDPQRLGFFIDPDIGDRDGDHQFKHRAFYRTNTREAWGMALYVAYEYRRLLKAEKITFDPLKVAGAVRSVWYQNKLGTTAIPVHVAGLAIDFSYKDMTEEQKYRLKLLLDTLTNLGLLSFTDEENGNHFHVVVPKDKATREFYRGVYLKFFLN